MDKPDPNIVLSPAAELILAELYLAGKTGRDITVAEAASIVCMKTDFPPEEWTDDRLDAIEKELFDSGMIEESSSPGGIAG